MREIYTYEVDVSQSYYKYETLKITSEVPLSKERLENTAMEIAEFDGNLEGGDFNIDNIKEERSTLQFCP